jgi:hypothetical protein
MIPKIHVLTGWLIISVIGCIPTPEAPDHDKSVEQGNTPSAAEIPTHETDEMKKGTTAKIPDVVKTTLTPPMPDELIYPSDLAYLGTFRLPEGGDRPFTFSYSGSAITFNPNGVSSGFQAGLPGSLFVMGHDRLAYGELPDGNQVAEITIPNPVRSTNLAGLPFAEFIQDFHNAAAGFFSDREEIPQVGMLYLDVPVTGPKIHLAWGQHLEGDLPGPTHAWFNPDLSDPQMQSAWYLEDLSPYQVTDYMLEIPDEWARSNTQGRIIGTGRFRDGGWSGMGPALFAYLPWIDSSGTPAPPGTQLQMTALLNYESSLDTDSIECCLSGYQHADEWEGAAWLTTSGGRAAVLFAGTKSIGEKYWYGFANPAGPDQPCVEEQMTGQLTLCRQKSGEPCPDEDLIECADHNDYRGWWSTRWEAQFLFYNPEDFRLVSLGEIEPWEPQPYAVLNFDEFLFHNPDGVELDMVGAGVQRRYRIGDMAYDRENGLLYVLELFADEAKPVVHVWRIEP